MPRSLIVALVLGLPLFAQDGPIYKVTDNGVTKPTLIRKVEPRYSESAKEKKIEGSVMLKIVISPVGVPRDLQVGKSLDPDLDANAIAAVKQWRFKPGMKDGTPVAVYTSVEVRFHLP